MSGKCVSSLRALSLPPARIDFVFLVAKRGAQTVIHLVLPMGVVGTHGGDMEEAAEHCDKRYEHDFQDPGENTPYGPWLRAAPSNRSNPRTGESKFGKQEHGMGSEYFASRFPRPNTTATTKRGMQIFSPTPSAHSPSSA
ncbi:hypothetical protein Salat_2796400 [Sesamum alatum]|uniref:Uncharacterized protein n=1 Tax=Sesamum alatum TaxID=300844 RepID=A0AAE1XM25_9LAMI|nr:hypothetical protein Salat_2796400 [Sesamum alatum]